MIASFQVDHDVLKKGIYLSRVDGDVMTYDIRTCTPNGDRYLDPKTIHTMEHLFATFARNSRFGDSVIYVGPMGCRTGFYLLTRGLRHPEVIELIKESFRYMADFEGEIPGSKKKECGNYREHDLSDAKKEAAAFLPVIESWTVHDIYYQE